MRNLTFDFLLLSFLFLPTSFLFAAENQPWGPGNPVPREVIESARALRHHMLADPYRPGYHFVPPEDRCMPGDPNGALFYHGRYHLMYLFHDGKVWGWGHISSKDLVHWRHHPTALGPGEGDDGIFSGGACLDKEGKATLTYWGLAQSPGRGVCLAQSDDKHLDRWTKSPANPVIRSTHWGYTVEKNDNGEQMVYGSADPSNIWIKDGRYYMLTGNLLVLEEYGQKQKKVEHQGDTAYLMVSDDLKTWKYLHPFYQSKREWTHAGEDCMCPSFLPLPSSPDGGPESGKHLLLFISHCQGCQYYIGTYENDRFIPEKHGRMSWVDRTYFAPEALIDDQGRQIMWAWLRDDSACSFEEPRGWSGVYGLPRTLWLGEDGTLRMRPVQELAALREKEQTWGPLTLEADTQKPLENFRSDSFEMEITLHPEEAKQFGLKVCRSDDGKEETLLFVDRADGTLKVDSRNSGQAGYRTIEAAPFVLGDNEPLVLRVFVDKSVVEVYANDRQAIARRIFPTRGKGVALFSNGGKTRIEKLRAWEMMPSNPY